MTPHAAIIAQRQPLRLPDGWGDSFQSAPFRPASPRPASAPAAASPRIAGAHLADRVLACLTVAAELRVPAPYRHELAEMLERDSAAINHAFQALAARGIAMDRHPRGQRAEDYALTLPDGRVVRTAGMPA